MSRRLLLVLVALAVVTVAMVAVAQTTGDDDGGTNPLGTEVVVGHSEAGVSQPGPRTQIGLTVVAVRTGTQAQLAANGLEVDEDSRDTTPYYVDARFANRGSTAVKRNLDVGLEDSDGNLIGRTLIFGGGNATFEPCREVTEGTLAPGESYESCTLVLVPNGVDVGKVYFLSDNGVREPGEFVYWATE